MVRKKVWYNKSMTIHQFIKERPYLVWYVKDLDNLSEESIVEHVLNYGDWNDVRVYNRVLSATEVTALYNLGR